MAKAKSGVRVTFLLPKSTHAKFIRIAKDRGHTMTWYLLGCINEVIAGKRRENGEGKGGVVPKRKRKAAPVQSPADK